MSDYLLITCEHGGNRIPLPYRYLFQNAPDRVAVNSHRGFDRGALVLARELAAALSAPLLASTTSRLLVDLNRSVGHPHLHGQAIRMAPAEVRRRIIENYYRPYRRKGEQWIRRAVDDGRRVIHISCHSFTPELDGQVRTCDVGLLYHPARIGEVGLCERWKASFKTYAPELTVRRNYPYAGKNDGFTAYLRQRFSPEIYVGIELEVNQKHVTNTRRGWVSVRTKIIESLRRMLNV